MTGVEISDVSRWLVNCHRPEMHFEPISEPDAHKLLEISAHHGLASLLYYNFCKQNCIAIPIYFHPIFREQYLKTFSQNSRSIRALHTINERFSDQKIEFIVLKGMALLISLYRDIGTRPMSDIDILIRAEDVTAVSAIFESLGFQQRTIAGKSDFITKLHESHQLDPWIADGVRIELHTHIYNSNDPVRGNIEQYFNSARSVAFEDRQYKVFEPSDMVTHLLSHLGRHFFYGHIRIHWFNEIAWFASENDIDWEKVLAASSDRRYLNIIFLLQHYYGMVIPGFSASDSLKDGTFDLEQVFFSFLSDRVEPVYVRKNRVFRYKLNTVKGRSRWKLIVGEFFPDLSFMKQRYNTKSTFSAVLHYPVRWCVGFYRLLALLFGRSYR